MLSFDCRRQLALRMWKKLFACVSVAVAGRPAHNIETLTGPLPKHSGTCYWYRNPNANPSYLE